MTVVQSRKQLRENWPSNPEVVDNLPELHRPWVDEVKIKCPKCGEVVSRVPEVGDAWLDAGIVSFSTLNYLDDPEYWRKWFPADWVSEMREQIRLWFYSMLIMSVTLEDTAPYKAVNTYEKVYDENGRPDAQVVGQRHLVRRCRRKDGRGCDALDVLLANTRENGEVICLVSRPRDACDRECRSLPEVVVIDLGDRRAELVPQVVLGRAHEVTLVLQRRSFGKVELDGEDRDEA